MKDLDKYQKLIWENSINTRLPKPPNVENSWRVLIQKININDKKIVKKNIVLHTLLHLKNWSTNTKKYFYKPIIAYSLIFIFISYFSIQYSGELKLVNYNKSQEPLILPDGSTITLNSVSSIKYKRNFIESREIILEGEAFFNVQKGKTPFIIITDFGKIEVLGTLFNVRSRNDGFEIGVNEGIVKVSNKESSFLIKKDQIINVNTYSFNENQVIEKIHKEYPDWMNNKLYFNNTPILEVCGELERNFKIKINFLNPKAKTINVTGIIETLNINTVLNSLSLLTKHQFKLQGETCTIF